MPHKDCENWFASWFDSPYYHLLYKDHDIKEAELFIDNLIDFLHPAKDARFLDLACGKGRHSIYLNKKGFDVTGIDLSAKSIDYAMQFAKDNLRFYVHDMRYPCRINYFDYIVNLFTSFGYFDNEKDNYTVMSGIEKSLHHNGMLVIDFMNAVKVRANLVENQTKVVEGITFTIHKKVEDDFIVKQIAFEDKGKKHFFEEWVKALTLSDFEKYLNQNNLKIVNLFGDYRLNPFNLQSSDRLIIIAKKH